MNNRYSFFDKEADIRTPIEKRIYWWYFPKMRDHDLSYDAIEEFAKALKEGDLKSLTSQFEILSDKQKTGLLDLFIDYNELVDNPNALTTTKPRGYAIKLAKEFGYDSIVQFFEETMNKLTTHKISFVK